MKVKCPKCGSLVETRQGGECHNCGYAPQDDRLYLRMSAEEYEARYGDKRNRVPAAS